METAIHLNSSDSDPISIANLSPVQAQVVTALARGETVTAAAREAGLHRTTIHHWFRNQPEFRTAVQCAEREYCATLSDEMSDLAARALETLRSVLDDASTPPAVRLKAALAILQRPRFPQQGWTLPERIESPREREFTDGLAEIEVDYRAMRMSEALESNARRTELQSSAPPARSAPCPCGSGQKYKRCCGRALAFASSPAAPAGRSAASAPS